MRQQREQVGGGGEASSQHPRELAQPVVVGGQRHVVRAGAADRGGDRRAALGLGGGERGADPRRGGVGLDGARRSPGRGARAGRRRAARASRGSVISIAVTAWRWASVRSGACHPSSRKSETTATRPRVRARRPTRSSAAAQRQPAAVPSGATPAPTSRRTAAKARAARARRQRRARGRAGRDDGDAAAAADGELRDRRGDALGDVGLQAQPGAERHRRAQVEHDPGRQRALGHVLADVRDAGARAGRRIELARVVARLVRAQLGELGARADARRPALARQRAAGAAGDPRGRAARPRRGRAARGPGGRVGRSASRRLRQAHGARGLDGRRAGGR